jgi:N-terminal acetyltransferase B complex non-catalytic subunit
LVYRQQGFRAEALEILGSKNLGIRSTVAKGDWSFVRQKLDLLEEQGLWEREWEFCKILLDEAFPGDGGIKVDENPTTPDAKGDDWRVWQGFLTASRNIDTEEYVHHRFV